MNFISKWFHRRAAVERLERVVDPNRDLTRNPITRREREATHPSGLAS